MCDRPTQRAATAHRALLQALADIRAIHEALRFGLFEVAGELCVVAKQRLKTATGETP